MAHEAAPIREAALRVLGEAGFEGVGVAEGESARTLLLAPPHPVALVVDVGLPGILGYELCDEVRRHALPIKVVFIASVYSRTAYKRRPTSLYGADDYVEQHHVVDQLVPKLARLLKEAPPPAPRDVHDPFRLTPEERAEVERIRAAGEGRLALEARGAEEARAQARRLARLLVADVALYNGAAVEAGLSAGELRLRLERDLAAARELFARAVPPDLASAAEFIDEAFERFLASRQGKEKTS